MSRVLDEVRAQQDRGVMSTIVSDLEARAADQRRVFKMVEPRGRAILAWCRAHPAECAGNEALVDALERALKTEARLTPSIVALWSEVPETMAVRP